MTNKVAYSVIKKLSVDQDERVIEGIMATPTPDRVGDVLEPMGVRYALPLPLLWQHRHDQPIGNVEYAKPNVEGIPFRARIAKVTESGALKDRVDEAWQSLKYGLIRAVSIGFGVDDDGAEIMRDGGYRFTSWELRELSLVTIPANADATINVIRSIDTIF